MELQLPTSEINPGITTKIDDHFPFNYPEMMQTRRYAFTDRKQFQGAFEQ